jgi:hypothetical protein
MVYNNGAEYSKLLEMTAALLWEFVLYGKS